MSAFLCNLITSPSWEGSPDIECGKPAAYRHGDTYFCESCYNEMAADDPEYVEGFEYITPECPCGVHRSVCDYHRHPKLFYRVR